MLFRKQVKDIVHIALAACSLFKDKLYFVLPPSVFLTKLQKQQLNQITKTILYYLKMFFNVIHNLSGLSNT